MTDTNPYNTAPVDDTQQAPHNEGPVSTTDNPLPDKRIIPSDGIGINREGIPVNASNPEAVTYVGPGATLPLSPQSLPDVAPGEPAKPLRVYPEGFPVVSHAGEPDPIHQEDLLPDPAGRANHFYDTVSGNVFKLSDAQAPNTADSSALPGSARLAKSDVTPGSEDDLPGFDKAIDEIKGYVEKHHAAIPALADKVKALEARVTAIESNAIPGTSTPKKGKPAPVVETAPPVVETPPANGETSSDWPASTPATVEPGAETFTSPVNNNPTPEGYDANAPS